MHFNDNNHNVFSYVLSLPKIQDKDEETISYEYMGSYNAFNVTEDDYEK